MIRMIAMVRDMLTLLAVTAGVPVMLIAVAGPPIPERLWSTAVLRTWFHDPLQPGYAAATARSVAWLLWAACTTVILICLAVQLRHLPARIRRMSVYLPPPVQGLTATMLGAAAVTSTAAPAAAAPPPVTVTDTMAPTVRDVVFETASPRTAAHAAAWDPITATPGTLIGGNAHHGLERTAPKAVPQDLTCTVRDGDTLFDIAAQHLGDGDRWPEIFALNKGTHFHRTGGTLTDPDLIYPGWVLRLPDNAAKPAPQPPPAPPTGSRPATSTPSPSGPSTAPAVPASTSPSIATPPSPQQTQITALTPRPATPGIPAPAATTTEHSGVDLGDHGWVAAEVATAVSAAAALLWIQRRRRYRPRPPDPRRDDTDLRPQPAAVAALHQHTRTPAEDTDMDLRTPRPPEAAVTAAALGTHSNHTPVRIPELPAHGVGFTGPGAPAAARGVLAAVLSAGGPWASDAEATIITTRTDLELLLDNATPPGLDRLHIVDDTLREAERHLLYRARTATDDTPATAHTHDPHPGLAPTIIVTAAPTGRDADRLAAILAVGSRLGITAVLTGTWHHGDTWTIAANGTTTTGSPPTTGTRLNTLDTTATIAILDTLSHARPSDTDLPTSVPAPHPTPTRAATRRPPTQPEPAHPRTTPRPTRTPASAPEGSPTPATDSVTAASAAARPSPERPLLVTLLGRPRIEVRTPDGPADLRVRRTDGIQILVHLAIEANGATSDQLMAALWPEVRPRYARGRFHTTISELRGLLNNAVHTEVVLRTGERYHLDPDTVDVDLWHLNDAIDRASTALEPAAHIDALHDVIDLYPGVLADGHNWLWLAPYRERTRRHILDTHIALADTEYNPKAALAHVENAIRLDPYNEDIYQHAMRLHAKLASTNGIRRTLRALSERLTELEIQISPQTQQIATELINRVHARHRIADTAA